MVQRIPSVRTWLFLVGGLGAVILMALVIALSGDAEVAKTVSNAGAVLITSTAAFVACAAAVRMGKGSPVRAQWLPIGLGLAFFAVGDTIWAYYEVVLATDAPWPGLADFAYVAGYPLIAYGVIRAGLAWKGRAPIANAAIIAGLAGIIGTITLWYAVIRPSVVGAGLSSAEAAISIFYPLADVLFGLTPAVFVILVVMRLGGGRLAWPWFAVAAGVLLYCAADALYAGMNAAGTYAEGDIVDYGWVMGYTMIAFGAALALDLATPAASSRKAGS